MNKKKSENTKIEIPKERVIIREFLKDNNLTSVWAINRLAERGIKTSRCEFSLILSGNRNGAKIDQIIAAMFQIMEEYSMKPINDNLKNRQL